MKVRAGVRAPAEVRSAIENGVPTDEPVHSTDALYEHDDLIIDGDAHKRAFERLVRNAAERIIIHSTFIADDCAQTVLPMLLATAAKGVSIDIFWGQNDVGSNTSSSRLAAERLRALVAQEGRSDSITVHRFTTNSHGKIAIADNGRGRWTTLLGSCNWLAADFTSFEASVKLCDPIIVGQLIRRIDPRSPRNMA